MLGKLFGKPKKAKTARQLSPAIRTSIINLAGSRGIPTMPASAQKVFQLSTDPNAEARDFIGIIEADESLTARVIKIANSVYFERGKKSTTIDEAVLVIGLDELKNLLNANALTEIFPSRHLARHQLWANDIATALIARSLSRQFAIGIAGVAFLGGLMHDIGKLFLLQRLGGEYQKVLDQVQREGCSFTEAEEELLSFNHTEVGQLIGERWHFTEDLIDIIRCHHEPWQVDGSLTLTELVSASDLIAHALGLGHPTGFHKLKDAAEERLEQLWLRLDIAVGERKALLAELERTYNHEYELYAK